MCTVTFIPKNNNDFILTSNRDEAPSRISLPPDFYELENTTTLFPKDVVSGGTWIGVSEMSRLICVLNGGTKRHERKFNYRKSRGLVTKDFLIADSTSELHDFYDFSGIEPFTMIIVEWREGIKLFELVVNEEGSHFNELSIEPRIWSSTTLYTEAMKTERQEWFKDFIDENALDSQTLLTFHKTAGKGNLDYGVVMDRGFVKTTSRTQVEKTSDRVEMRYENLKEETTSKQSLSFPQAVNE